MTQHVIDVINKLGVMDGIMNGLKIQNKAGVVLYDSSWLEGVDYVNNKNINNVNNNGDLLNQTANESEENDNGEPSSNENYEGQQPEEEEYDELDPNEVEEEYFIPSQDNPVPGTVDDPELVAAQEQPDKYIRRSTRSTQPPERLEPVWTGQTYTSNVQYNNFQGKYDNMDYVCEDARAWALIISEFADRIRSSHIENGTQCVVTYSLSKAIKKFGKPAEDAALKEVKQLHDRECFIPISKEELNELERRRALESLIFLTEKRDGTIKARQCANGSTQRDYMTKEDVSSPTVSTEATLLRSVIDAEEGRDVATMDIPNAFIQTIVEDRDSEGNRTIMKIRGLLVDLLCQIDLTYIPYVITENGQKVLYVHVKRAIYGMLVSAMLFYKKFVTDLTNNGFELNPYDPCVANKVVEGEQLTASWHVDDLMASHKNTKVVDGFHKWVENTYGKIGKVKCTRGKVHDYLGMKLDFTVPGQVTVDMIDYVKSMVENFPQGCLEGSAVASPWNENLFKPNESSTDLTKEEAEVFHTVTAQGLFLTKRARPDIAPAIAYLTTRVKKPNRDDWLKLTRMMKWLKQTTKDRLTLRSDGTRQARWHADAAFAVHPDFRSHTGATFTLGRGSIASVSRKQGINTRSSTEAEIIAADEIVGPMLWTALFLEAQGYPLQANILYQDNQSAIQVEKNGRKSVGKRSRHLNIRLFFVTDQVEKGRIQIKFCPTDLMVADYMTKPLHGTKFKQFREEIMNLSTLAQQVMFSCMMIDKS
jgi:hypothetical protein